MEKLSYIYMMGSASRRALYTGVTVPLYERVWQHKNNQGGYFTSKYKCYRLLYYEQFANVETAIAREKEIKGWRREKKDELVESMNPDWKRSGRGLVSGRTSDRWRSGRFRQAKRKVPRAYSRAEESARSRKRPSG